MEAIAELIRSYPFKEYQTNYYGVDRNKLDEFNIHRIRATVQSEASNCYSVIRPDGHLAGAFVLNASTWHTDLFGIKYFKVGSVWATSDHYKPDIVKAIVTAGEQAGAELLDLRTDADDLPLAQALEDAGGDLLGMSVKYASRSKDLDKISSDSYADSQKEDVAVRPAEEGDLDWIREVAEESHSVSYFFNSRFLPPDKTHQLFSLWAQRCEKGLADAVLVMTVEDQPAGFVTLLLPRSLSEPLGKSFGVLDFIAVSSRFKGRGLGKRLALEAFRWLAERSDLLEARTMVNNFPAQTLYIKLGFRVIAADIHFHIGINR